MPGRRHCAIDRTKQSAGSERISLKGTPQGWLTSSRCDAEGFAEAAEFVRGWLPKRDPLKLYIFKLPESLEAPEAFTASDAAKKAWQAFVELRRAQAAALFELGAESPCREAIRALVRPGARGLPRKP